MNYSPNKVSRVVREEVVRRSPYKSTYKPVRHYNDYYKDNIIRADQVNIYTDRNVKLYSSKNDF